MAVIKCELIEMKFLLCILIAVAHFPLAIAQETGKRSAYRKPKGDPSCVYKLKYSAAERKNNYPFNIADTVKLV